MTALCLACLANAILCHPMAGGWESLSRHRPTQYWVSLSILSAPLLAPASLALALWMASTAAHATPMRTAVALTASCASIVLWAHVWYLMITD